MNHVWIRLLLILGMIFGVVAAPPNQIGNTAISVIGVVITVTGVVAGVLFGKSAQ